MVDLCFACGANSDECVCHPQETFWLRDILFTSTNVLKTVFYHEVNSDNTKYEESCFNCSKQYTLLCEKLPEQLITINKEYKPAYKLDTCEYIEKEKPRLSADSDIFLIDLRVEPDKEPPF